MLSDSQLIKISGKIDTQLSNLLTEYNDLTILSVSAIVLARLMALHKETESTEDMIKLMNSIIQNPPVIRNERILQ